VAVAAVAAVAVASPASRRPPDLHCKSRSNSPSGLRLRRKESSIKRASRPASPGAAGADFFFAFVFEHLSDERGAEKLPVRRADGGACALEPAGAKRRDGRLRWTRAVDFERDGDGARGGKERERSRRRDVERRSKLLVEIGIVLDCFAPGTVAVRRILLDGLHLLDGVLVNGARPAPVKE
jgi:hypothetical protein